MYTLNEVDYKLFFNSLPGLYLILFPDFTIAAISDAYLKASMKQRELILGRDLFDVFPDNPDDKEANGVANLRASLQLVLQTGKPQSMPIQKYDMRNFQGVFEERYWSPINTPIYNCQHEIVYILHHVIDVTKSRRLEQAIIKQEKDYQLLVQSVRDYAIFMVDASGKVMSWNSGAEHITGYSAEEIIGQHIEIFYGREEKKKGVPNHILNMAASNDHFETEGWRVRKDGQKYWVNLSVTALKNDKGHLYGFTVVSKDMSEKKESQKQVASLSRQINQSNDAIITTDSFNKITSWNIGAQKLYGFKHAEVIGKDVRAVLKSPVNEDFLSAVLQAIETNGFWSGEVIRITKAGKQIEVHSSITAVRDSNGVITGFVSVSFDVSHQKKLQEQVNHLANIVEQSSEAIISRNLNWEIISWNKGAEKLFGFTASETLGKSVNEIGIIHFTKEEIAAQEKQLMEAGFWQAEKKYFHKNGYSFECLVTANAVVNSSEEATSVVCFINDISISKKLETQLKKYNEKLEADVRARTEDIEKRENLFRALIENSNDIITLMDASFKVIYRSPAAARIIGWTNEDMMGVPATKNIHPDDIEYALSVVEEVMAHPGTKVTTQFRMMHKAGHFVWIEGSLTNLLEDKFVQAVIFNFRDITERVAAEQKLKASEHQFRNTLMNMLEGIQILSFDWKYLFANDAMVNFSKFSREQLIGFTLMQVYPGIEQTELFAALQRCMTNRVSEYIVTEFVYPDGSKADFELSIQPVPEGLFVLSMDITAKKQAEAQKEFDANNLNALINNTNDLMWSLDTQLRLITSNKAFDKMVEEITGKVPLKGAVMETAGYSEAQIQRFMVYYDLAFSGQSFTDIYFDHNMKASWYEVSFSPIFEGDVVIGTACYSRNITEQKKTEERIRKTNERFELVVSATNDVIWDWDLKANTFWRNQHYYSHFGYDEKKVAPDNHAWLDCIHPEDRKRVLAGVKTCMKNKQHFWTDEYRYLKADRSIAFVQDAGYIVYDDAGKSIRMVGAMLDITSRKMAEQQLNASLEEKNTLAERMSVILNTLPAHIALLDATGRIIDVNESWRNFADNNGFAGSNAGVGDNYIQISRNASGDEASDGRRAAKGIQDILKNKIQNFVLEYPCHSPTEQRWFRMEVTPLRGKHITGAVVMHTNITALRQIELDRLKAQMEEQKKISKAILQGQERERNYIGRELHDNINQLLAGTKMYMVLAGKKNEELQSLIKYPVELLDTSMEEIRSLCHKMVTPIKDIDLQALIMVLLNNLEEHSKTKTMFTYLVPNGLMSDELQLNIYRILQELMNNIMKYASASLVTIKMIGNENSVDITVTDNGVGFDFSKKRNGIGISNIINRVQSFNGTLNIDTAIGAGCKTSISIPYER